MASTRRTELVLIESDRKVVVSPADTAQFIALITAEGAQSLPWSASLTSTSSSAQ